MDSNEYFGSGGSEVYCMFQANDIAAVILRQFGHLGHHPQGTLGTERVAAVGLSEEGRTMEIVGKSHNSLRLAHGGGRVSGGEIMHAYLNVKTLIRRSFLKLRTTQ